MSDLQYRDRITFHRALEVMEVDFSGLTFGDEREVDRFYDEADALLKESGSRWYFLVNYTDSDVNDTAWARFAERGKQTNINYSLGSVRFGVSAHVREEIRSQAREQAEFRANLYESRDDALFAISELHKRHRTASKQRQYLLEVSDIHLHFGGVRALDGVGFQVEEGEIFSIIGPNGAGKTSMLNVISGFYKPSRGQILFDGKDRTRCNSGQVARLGFARTFQNIALFKRMSTLDNIMTGRFLKMKSNVFYDAIYVGRARAEEEKHREQVEQVIDFLEIQEIRKTPVGRLPYGLQKRVELGRALVMEPRVLLLDEPMAGMNLEEKEDMARFVLDANEQWGTTLILIEHDMSVVMDISTQVVVLDHGEKIAEGAPDEIRNDPVVIRAYLGEH